MIQSEILSNGVRLIWEPIAAVRSCALGIFVATGSRHEASAESGAAHFIEHMLFKGTENRSAAALAAESDFIGGQLNAYTTKETTCFYVRCLDEHLGQASELLCDMFFRSRFDEGDVQTELGVILEEIGMYEDTPDDLVSERLAAAVYGRSSLGRPILGREKTLRTMTGESLRAYKDAHYRGGDVVVALAGSFSQEQVDRLREEFSQLPAGQNPSPKYAVYRPAVTAKKRAIEQNHLTLAFPGLPFGHERRYEMQVLSSILGGGVSSRLFQNVREQQGLCYSIYSYGSAHEDTGLFCIYTALGKDTEQQALATVCETIVGFTAEGPTAEEVHRAREQSKSNVLMGMESTQSRMSHLGRSSLFHDHIPSAEEIAAAYDAVTRQGVQDLAQEIFDFAAASLSAVGRVAPTEEYRDLLRRCQCAE